MSTMEGLEQEVKPMALFKAIDWNVDMDKLEAFTVFDGNQITAANPLDLSMTGIVTVAGFSHDVTVDMKSVAGHHFTYTPHIVKLTHDLFYTVSGGTIGSIDVHVDGLDAYKFKGISADAVTVMNDATHFPYHPKELLKDLLGTGKVTIIGSSSYDTLDGQHAHATFVYKTEPFGSDTVEFRAGDKIEFAKSILDSLSDVKAHASIVGGDVVIAPPSPYYNDTITLATVHHISDLTVHDFLFV
jgi:hypothetical protein